MSTSQLTAVAAVIAFAAAMLLVLLDVRKPARRPAPNRRGRRTAQPPMEPEAVPAVLYRHPRWYRRLASIGGLGAMAVVVGFVVALAGAVVIVGLFFVLREATG